MSSNKTFINSVEHWSSKFGSRPTVLFTFLVDICNALECLT